MDRLTICALLKSTVMCPANSGKEVFATLADKGGWNNMGTVDLVSQVSVLYCDLDKLGIGHPTTS
ncbi:hypothetical protein A1O7_07902 [Cladophialophora yegresii CBS 114405]|uniref:Uncharacterized protein n=1 Tax=Cladophialophora yegresii CBS 114405 TaxID=1182544 RepID=W9WGA8_9EURO|nr:uncharacterized protein A1O7_07902 [Cladophialophora yegresii CBS 114405]EXJ57554.1 hypothetical protein A1O7_07902 [Cladophialophora yegresii CBS 114405]